MTRIALSFRSVSNQLLVFAVLLPIFLYSIVLGLLPNLTAVKFVLGVASMIFVPGYVLISVLGVDKHTESLLGLSLVAGLLVQLGNVFLLYVIEAIVKIGGLNFPLYMLLITTFEVMGRFALPRVTTSIHSAYAVQRTSRKFKLSTSTSLLLVSFIANLLFQTFNHSAVLPDGALFLDTARYAAETGRFSSHVLNDGTFTLQNQLGLSFHIGSAMIYSIFFSIGDTSYQVAKWGAALIGALIISPVYEIGKLSYGRIAGLISCALILALPLFRFYSVMLYGPEILSLLLAVFSMLLVLWAVTSKILRLAGLAGAALFFSNLVWVAETVPFVATMALIFAFLGQKRANVWKDRLIQSIAPLILFAVMLGALAVSTNIQLWLLVLSTTFGLIVTYRYLGVENLKQMALTSITFLTLMQLFLFRFYLLPGAAPSFEPSSPYFSLKFSTIASTLIVYVWPYWYFVALPIIIPALLGIFWVTKRALIPYAFLFGWLFTRLTLLPTQSSIYYANEERFYLSITLFSAIFAGGFFSKAGLKLQGMSNTAFLRRQSNVPKILFGSRLRSSLIGVLFVAIVLGSSLPLYSLYLNRFYVNSVEENGLTPVISWIHANTNGNALILTTGSPRLWAWFTDRVMVGTTIVTNNALLALDQIGPTQIVDLISEFSPSFVIFDSTYQAALLFLPRLSYLYGDFPSGKTFTLNTTSKTVYFEAIISSTSAVNNGTVTLYRIVS